MKLLIEEDRPGELSEKRELVHKLVEQLGCDCGLHKAAHKTDTEPKPIADPIMRRIFEAGDAERRRIQQLMTERILAVVGGED